MNDETAGGHGPGPGQPMPGGGPQMQRGAGPVPPQNLPPGPPQQYAPPGYHQQPPPGYQQAQPQAMAQPYPQQGYPAQAAQTRPSAWPLPRIAALIVVLMGLGTLIASLFSLYTAKVTPSDWDFAPSGAPSGSVSVGLGFYDTVPFQAPIIAVAIPMFMLIAGLTAVPMVLGGRNQKPVLPAFFSLAAALIAVVLMIAGPMPGVQVDGQMGREVRAELGSADLNKLIDTVVPISPGVGLILALIFAVIGAAGALYLYALAERGQRGGNRGSPSTAAPAHTGAPNWQPQQGGQQYGQNW